MAGQSVGSVIQISVFAFGLMAAIALATAGFIAALVAGLAALGRRSAAQATPVAVVATPTPTPLPVVAQTGRIDPAVVAVIAAAVHATIGAHRIIWIGETPPTGGWVGEVRQRHHVSHNPHHDH